MYEEASHETQGPPARDSAAVMSQSFPRVDRPMDVPSGHSHRHFRRALPHADRPMDVPGGRLHFHHGRRHAPRSPDARPHDCHRGCRRGPQHVQDHDRDDAPRHDPNRARHRDRDHPLGGDRRVPYSRLDHFLGCWWNEQAHCVRHPRDPTNRASMNRGLMNRGLMNPGSVPRESPAVGPRWCARRRYGPTLDARLSLGWQHLAPTH